MTFPDIIGFTLGEAAKEIEKSGMEISSVTVTSPPRTKTGCYEDYYRVVRTTIVDKKKVELLVCKPL